MTVQDLIQAKEESASVAYQKFILLININSDFLFCFFENKDAPYYNLRIKHHYKGESCYISCGNKSKVLKTHKLIKNHREYDRYKVAFFIDQDFDDSIKDEFLDIYETPCYSIENLYTSTSLIKELIKTDFQIGEEDPSHATILSLYQRLQSDFLNASLLFNAWYKLQKKKGKNSNVEVKVSLDDSLIPALIELNINSIVSKNTEAFISLKYPNALPYTSDELDNVIRQLCLTDLRYSLRGKFVFNFVTNFIRKLIEDSADTSKQTIVKRKIRYNMDNSTALTLLTCYAETPQCLIDFLGRYN